MKPSEPALKATDSFWKQQSRSAASDEASNLSAEFPTSYNLRLCAKKRLLLLKSQKCYELHIVEPKSIVPLTESQEEMRRLSDFGAKRILEIASRIGFSNFKAAPLILLHLQTELNQRIETENEHGIGDGKLSNFFRINEKGRRFASLGSRKP